MAELTPARVELTVSIDKQLMYVSQRSGGFGLHLTHRLARCLQCLRGSVGGAAHALGQGVERRIEVVRDASQRGESPLR